MNKQLNDAEIDAAARRVFEARGLWKPGQICDNWVYRQGPLGVEIDHDPHEIAPPDWRDWNVFGQLLMGLWPKTWHILFSGTAYKIRCEISERATCKVVRSPLCYDPRAALILALDAMGTKR